MSVFLGQHVKETLMGCEALTEKVADRIYPVIAIQGVPQYPFVRYFTEVTDAEYDKGPGGLEHVEDHCMMTVHCVSKEHDPAIYMLDAARKALECKGGIYTNFKLDPARVQSADCYFDTDLAAFVGELVLTTNTQPVEENDNV